MRGGINERHGGSYEKSVVTMPSTKSVGFIACVVVMLACVGAVPENSRRAAPTPPAFYATTTEKWAYKIGGEARSLRLSKDGTVVYAGSGEGCATGANQMYAISAAGKLLWCLPTHTPGDRP